MAVLSKKYTRLFIYFITLCLIAGATLWVGLNRRRFVPLLAMSSKDSESGHYGVVVNLGIQNCFHLGTWLRVCSASGSVFGSDIERMPSIKRKLIAKDLLNSERYHWFGRSQFLWYDVLKVDSVTDLRVIPSGVKVNGITSITGDTKECKYRLMDLCVLSAELNESSLEDTRFLSDLSLLFGEDATEPRSDWELNRKLVVSDVRFPSYITASFWNNEVRSPKLPSLTLNEQQKFKIVQLADLHFSVGKGTCRDEFPAHDTCEADPKTLQFIDQVLDIEKPQLVVFTGDQIMGDECKQDSETALLKALAPVIAREIPWTIVWGNHDDEGSLSRWQLSEFAKKLPYSLFEIGPSDTKDNQFGVGNYVIEVQGSHGKTKIALYFLDSHKYSQSKAFPGYDWIKEDQWKYMEGYQANHESIKLAQNSGDLLSMAFFHIPLPEYTDFPPEAGSNRVIGSYKEGITAPKYNSEGLKTLHKLGVTVTSVGHDHCNDYCLLNEADDGKDKIWLCYGGGTGEGGYGGYGGTERRIRIFEIDALKKDIHSWKRLNGSPENTFDSKILVSDGVPYTA